LDRGARLVELLKQPQYKPMPIELEVMVIYAGTKGYLDDVPLNRVQNFQDQFLQYVQTNAADLRSGLEQKRELSDDLENKLKQALTEFKSKVWKAYRFPSFTRKESGRDERSSWPLFFRSRFGRNRSAHVR
jgi:F0F1-type ATP synthase alpha subunit